MKSYRTDVALSGNKPWSTNAKSKWDSLGNSISMSADVLHPWVPESSCSIKFALSRTPLPQPHESGKAVLRRGLEGWHSLLGAECKCWWCVQETCTVAFSQQPWTMFMVPKTVSLFSELQRAEDSPSESRPLGPSYLYGCLASSFPPYPTQDSRTQVMQEHRTQVHAHMHTSSKLS